MDMSILESNCNYRKIKCMIKLKYWIKAFTSLSNTFGNILYDLRV